MAPHLETSFEVVVSCLPKPEACQLVRLLVQTFLKARGVDTDAIDYYILGLNEEVTNWVKHSEDKESRISVGITVTEAAIETRVWQDNESPEHSAKRISERQRAQREAEIRLDLTGIACRIDCDMNGLSAGAGVFMITDLFSQVTEDESGTHLIFAR